MASDVSDRSWEADADKAVFVSQVVSVGTKAAIDSAVVNHIFNCKANLLTIWSIADVLYVIVWADGVCFLVLEGARRVEEVLDVCFCCV